MHVVFSESGIARSNSTDTSTLHASVVTSLIVDLCVLVDTCSQHASPVLVLIADVCYTHVCSTSAAHDM